MTPPKRPTPFALSIILFFIALFLPHLSYAATIYANSSTGNDTTGDGSSGSPYATFHKAYTAAASSGDTLDLTGTFDWTNSGESGDASGSGYTISKSMTIQGNGTSTTYIQASSTQDTADRGVFTIAASKTVTIKNLTIRYGVTTSTETGGGITNRGTLTLQGIVVSYNTYNSIANYYGGGAINLPNDANATLTVSTSTIAYNTFNGKYYGSGGIYAGQTNTITVTASTFEGNVASSSNPTTFAYSYAEPSGAFGVFRFVTTVITNSTFSGNSTNAYGGAFQIYYPNSFKITNTTIANNIASGGAGGILFESATVGYNLHMKNSILANNMGGGSANDIYVVSGSDTKITDNGYNIVEYSTNKAWSATGDVTGDQSSLNLASTLATNSATNGIRTLALSASSVAIDTGNSTTHSSIIIPSYDQRGATRSSTTDIGSFEYGGGGLADVIAPTVSVTYPSSGLYVATTTALSATASDDVSVSGVKFYVDGVFVESEDTSSPYSITWDTTATSSATHSVVVVARDSSTNYATSSSVSFIIDNSAPIFSSLSASASASTSTITWTTDDSSSSLVVFGATTSYGSTTAEQDTSSRVTSHSVSLSDLSSCTLYYYKAQSINAALLTATSTNSSFTTSGCSGGASISTTTVGTITTAAGGTLTEGVLTLTVPTSFTATSSSATFQAHLLDGTAFFASAGAPSGKNRAGTTAYTLKALTDATTTLATFSVSLTVTLTYSASDVSGIDETTLKIYRYDGSNWTALSSCSVNTSTRTVTCSTTAFSDFALFGDASSSSSSSSSTTIAANGPIFVGSLHTTQQSHFHTTTVPTTVHIATTTNTTSSSMPLVPPPTLIIKAPVEATIPLLQSSYTFSRNLHRGMYHADVKELQKYLNASGFIINENGDGSPGFETTFFGKKTQEALTQFQIANNITPAKGFFGPYTRSLLLK